MTIRTEARALAEQLSAAAKEPHQPRRLRDLLGRAAAFVEGVADADQAKALAKAAKAAEKAAGEA